MDKYKLLIYLVEEIIYNLEWYMESAEMIIDHGGGAVGVLGRKDAEMHFELKESLEESIDQIKKVIKENQ